MKFEKEFRKDHPETIGETDHTFDLLNYSEWLENKIERIEKLLEEWKDCSTAVERTGVDHANNKINSGVVALEQAIEILKEPPSTHTHTVKKDCMHCKHEKEYYKAHSFCGFCGKQFNRN